MTEPQQRIDARTTIKLPLSVQERGALSAYLYAREKAQRTCDSALSEAWDVYLRTRPSVTQCRREAAAAEVRKVQLNVLGIATSVANARKEVTFTVAYMIYEATGHASPLIHWLLDNDDFPGDEVDQVIEALAEGMSLQGVIDMAEEQGWCDTWDCALEDALARFNFIE